MKEIKVERTVFDTKYEAIDGKVFSSREECEKYEESAFAVVYSKYRKLVINHNGCDSIFSVGCDEDGVDAVVMKTQEDADTVKQLYHIVNPHRKDDDGWKILAFSQIDEAFENNDVLLVGTGYDIKECMYIINTMRGAISKIKAFCDREQPEKEEREFNGGC